MSGAFWIWLDFLLFGNGFGTGAPFWDTTFYWKGGRFYTFMHGHGAQLHSFEWTVPYPGTRRTIGGKKFEAFSAHRKGPRVHVSWAWVDLPRDLDEANAAIRQLRADMGDSMMQRTEPA